MDTWLPARARLGRVVPVLRSVRSRGGRIPFPCPQDILAENVGWWWVNDKRCSHGTGEWHGRCCVCTMACDWKAGTDSRRAVGMRVAPLWWTNIALRRRVATSCCNRRAGCCQLRLNRQVARCDRQPASLFDNNSAVYLASNVCCLSFPYLQLHASRSILVPSARVCLACLPWVGRSDQSGGVCHRRTPLLFSGRCLSRRVALERGVCVSVPISCAPVTRSLRYALTD